MWDANDYAALIDIETDGTWEPMVSANVGDIVMIKSSFASGDEPIQVQLCKGMKGVIHSVDKDGDAKVWFPGLLRSHYQNFPWWFSVRWVLQNDHGKLLRRVKTA